MATTYQIAQGQNNAGGLATLNPQPRTDAPIQWEERESVSGEVALVGFGTVDLVWTAFKTYSELTTFLTAYFNFTYTSGMPNEQYVNVTFAARGWDGTSYKNYNARARILPLRRRPGRFEDVTVRLYRIVEI